MVALFLLAQLAAADSVYSTPALRAFVTQAAASLAARGLEGYRATLETDVAVLVTDVQGREHATQLEQLESKLSWQRSGQLEQHVVGYRSRGGPTLSALSVMRRPWVIPTLYEKHLRLLLGSAVLEGVDARPGRVVAVHPLADDREGVYRFSGGDTVAVIEPKGQRITLVRVHVTPARNAKGRLLLFRGDLDVDAERKQVVHMRGELGVLTRASLVGRVRRTAIRREVFIDVVDAQFGGRFWLPTYERVDVQARSTLSEGFRPGFRVVTHFYDHHVDSLPTAAVTQAGDVATTETGKLTFAPSDSLDSFRGWREEIGAGATDVEAHDFDDVAVEPSRESRAPRLVWRSTQLSDVFRYDKVEGVYTGVAGGVQSGDTTRRVSLLGHVGWAAAEETARGGATLAVQRPSSRVDLTAQRELMNTSDFIPPLEGPATMGALFASIDDYDYVERTNAQIGLTYAIRRDPSRTLRLEVGPGRDRAVQTNVRRGLIMFDSTFRPNRPVNEGSYVRAALALSVNPAVSGEFLEPGIGYTLAYERGDGRLRWQRVDATVTARHTVGRVTYFGRAVGAAVFGGFPYQHLIEFGENEGMPGYSYKEFGGDRAGIGSVGLSYNFPLLGAPIRVHRRITLPGPSPALTVTYHAGWSEAAAASTRRAFESLGSKLGPDGTLVPVTAPTNGVRSSVAAAFDFFGGAIGLGAAYRLDRKEWVFILGSQQW